MAHLKNTTKIIDVLGGTAEVARLTGRPQAQVSRWKRWGRFPPQCYLAMTGALAAKGHIAEPSLWGQQRYTGI